MIPIVDVIQLVGDLNQWGWRDYKIEVICGLGSGYVAQVRCGNIQKPSHDKVVRLYNFWEEEATNRGVDLPMYGPPVSRETLQTRIESVTT